MMSRMLPTSRFVPYLLPAVLGATLLAQQPAADQAPAADDQEGRVSYHRDILPLLQTHCLGCHQPAKASGDYVMTSFAKLLAGGESGEEAIVAGNPDESYLVQLITPNDGQAEMPVDKPPLAVLTYLPR